jgi:aspartate racemase
MGNERKTLGIIGGMGPMATADLFSKIISNTDAANDAGHIHILIDNNPKIPDRTQAVLAGSDAPLPYIVEAAQRLVQMGADLLLLPCNTSHAYYRQLCQAVSAPVVNMVEETAGEVFKMGLKRVGLLATKGTLHARLYENALDTYGIEALLPSAQGEAEVMSLIYDGVKAGAESFDIAAICDELRRMTARGAETFILGCTELPVAFDRYHIPFPYIDPSLILAKAAIVKAGYDIRHTDTARPEDH